MENTLENKAKFFGLFWGQKIFRQSGKFGAANVLVTLAGTCHFTEGYVELKPTSSISDEDAIEVAKIFGYKIKGDISKNNVEAYIPVKSENRWEQNCAVTINFKTGHAECNNGEPYEEERIYHAPLFVYDYLRSRGYALPFMGISVEQQVEWGWVKLTPPTAPCTD